MKTSRFRSSIFRVALTLVLTAVLSLFLAASQQQAPGVPPPPPPPSQTVPGRIILPNTAVPPIDPPQPASGEGVDLVIRVVDASTGDGLPNVKIDLSRSPVFTPQTATDRRRWIYSKPTDARGDASIPNMMADRYTIAATLMGYAVAGGAVDSVTLMARGKPAPIVLRMWKSASVEGSVAERDGTPVVGATVEILEEGWTGGVRTFAQSQKSVMTDKAGHFIFPAVMGGTYYMRAIPQPSMVQQQLKASAASPEKNVAFVDTLYPGVKYFEESAPISVDPGVDLFGLRIEMQKSPYYALSGRVFGIPAEVRSPGLVLIRRVSFDSPFPFVAATPYAGSISVRLATDGTFIAPSVPPGPYWAGYTPAGAVRGGGQFVIVDRNIDNFQFEVTPGVTFSGRAVYEDGKPSEGRPASLGVFLSNMGVYPRDFAIGPNGEFAVTGLPIGTYRLQIPGTVIKKIEINARLFPGGEFDLPPMSGQAVITLGRVGSSIQGIVDPHDKARSYPRGIVTVARQPMRATDVVIRKYLGGTNAFQVDRLEAGRYRACAWLEEGADVDRVLGSPRFEQKLTVSCETVEVMADQAQQVRLKQISSIDFRQ